MNGDLNKKSLHQIPRTMSNEHTCQISDHSSLPVLQEVASKLKNYVLRKTAICHLFDYQNVEDSLK